jgi:GntR family transcriptional regulator/MocR family aminotransferase
MKDAIATIWGTELSMNTGLSLQGQIHAKVRNSILNGDLSGGTRIPSSRMLADRLDIARITVVQAYDQLIAEGYLETRTGAGTFVSATLPDALVGISPQVHQKPPSMEANALRLLSAGLPALDQFPTSKWARTAGRATRQLNQQSMNNNDVMGFAPLRQNIADYLRASRSVICGPSQVMITSGLQQGLFLVASAILRSNQSIILEDPGYGGMLAAAKATQRPIRYTSVDTQGAVVPTGLSGLMVTCPSRQFPLGYTMPHSRRLEILAWAKDTNSLVFEDDYDSEFRYAGRPLNSLQGIDGGERVIYGGTFSKSLFNALRLGYLILPHSLVEPVRALRSAIDSFPSISNQQALHAFMEDGEFTRHVRRLRKVHAHRKTLFENAMASHLKNWLKLTPTDAGLCLLARPTKALLASEITDKKLAELGQKAGIGAASLSQNYRNTPPQQGLLMSFANLIDSEIDLKVRQFGKSLTAAITNLSE